MMDQLLTVLQGDPGICLSLELNPNVQIHLNFAQINRRDHLYYSCDDNATSMLPVAFLRQILGIPSLPTRRPSSQTCRQAGRQAGRLEMLPMPIVEECLLGRPYDLGLFIAIDRLSNIKHTTCK